VYVLFGAGEYAKFAVDFLGRQNIKYFVDNNCMKTGTEFMGIPVYYYNDKKSELDQYSIAIATSDKYIGEISEQLKKAGLTKYFVVKDMLIEHTKKKILERPDYISTYKKTMSWIEKNTVDGEGIINNTSLQKSYPEVTGYYIPTLIKWGYKETAIQYAKWLCLIQKPDGSWYDTEDKMPYVFDSAQILKGLLAVRDIYPYVDDNILKGCEWILTNMEASGRLKAPDNSIWNSKEYSELIHLYCLLPLVEASEVFHIERYKKAAFSALNYYKENFIDNIMEFGLLSHFYAYVIEALLDMGEIDIVRKAMSKLEKYQDETGKVPAYKDVDWVCSTGLFQLALIWFRLGDLKHGKKAFEYACKLQNPSGGWYGSYAVVEDEKKINDYFPHSEISWAAKYFLDALYYKGIAEFNAQAHLFHERIDTTDGRYIEVKNLVHGVKNGRVLDIGCGKGCYLKNLLVEEPQNQYYAVDISENVLKNIDVDVIIQKIGTSTNLPFPDRSFDMAYTCEALEHAVDIERAIKEMARVVKPGGKILIIDKNKEALGAMEIEDWEQWFDEKELADIMKQYCSEVIIHSAVAYEGKNDNLFSAWIGTLTSICLP